MIRKLLLRFGDEERVVKLRGDRLTFGRKSDSDIRVNDEALSRRHMIFERQGDDWIARDPGSKNRTFLNGEELRVSRPLRRGDRISAGRVTLICEGEPGEDTGEVSFVDEPTTASSVEAIVRSLDGLVSDESDLVEGAHLPTDNPAVQALLRASRELCSRRPLPELFEMILDLSTAAARTDRGVLMTLEGDELVPRAVRGEGFRISTDVRDRVIRDAQSLLVRDAQQETDFASMKTIVEQHVRTFMAVPLQTRDRVTGLIYVDCQHLRDFGPEDLELLTVLANVAATRIEQERLTLAEEEKQRYEQELQQAARIQAGLLPSDPVLPAGVEVDGFNIACRTVGGDYYDLMTQANRLALVIGDVAGKGLPAAMVMATVQARVQVLVEDYDDPVVMVSRLNRIMAKYCPDNRFVTLFVGLLDSSTGDLRYCSAGHAPGLVVRADGAAEWLECRGWPLGMLPDVDFDAHSCRLESGDVLLLYSDGVTEAGSPEGEEFGGRRLADHVRTIRHRTIDEILDSIRDTLVEWTGDRPFGDDVTVVAARRT